MNTKNSFIYLIVFSLVFLSACVDKKEKSLEHLNTGIQYLYAGEHQRALQEFNEAARLDPENPEIYLYRGNAYFNMGYEDKAMTEYNKAIEVKPDYAAAYFNRGNVWSYLSEREKACEDWKMAESLGKPNMEDKTRHCP